MQRWWQQPCADYGKAASVLRCSCVTGVGAPIPGTQIRIANAAGEAVAERVVGEIQLRTDSGMTGYYRDPEATRSAFQAEWLRTGDLGHVAGGTLYVTGRCKEIIIRGGQNLVPQVVEEAANVVGGVRQGGVAVVGVSSAARGTERAILVAETTLRRELHQELVGKIATTLKARALEVDEIQLVAPHTLPRTTSGKLRRRALATMLAASDPQQRNSSLRGTGRQDSEPPSPAVS